MNFHFILKEKNTLIKDLNKKSVFLVYYNQYKVIYSVEGKLSVLYSRMKVGTFCLLKHKTGYMTFFVDSPFIIGIFLK